MFTEITQLKNDTPAGDSNTTAEMVVEKSNTYQRQLLIVAGSSLATLVLTAVTCKTAGYSLVYTGDFAKSRGALVDYQVNTANSVLAKDDFGMSAVSENVEGSHCKYGICRSNSGDDICCKCPGFDPNCVVYHNCFDDICGNSRYSKCNVCAIGGNNVCFDISYCIELPCDGCFGGNHGNGKKFCCNAAGAL